MSKDTRLFPVYHHIAKCAGTYVLSWVQLLAWAYFVKQGVREEAGWKSERIRRMLITIKNKHVTLFYYTPDDMEPHQSKLTPGEDKSTDICKSNVVLEAIKTKSIQPFSISVDPEGLGYGYVEKFVEKLIRLAGFDHSYHYVVMRDPFERNKSLYNYLSRSTGSHEPTHDNLKDIKTLKDYLTSDHVEDGWLVRDLLNLTTSDIIRPQHITAVDGYLKHFEMDDIYNVDELIDRVYTNSFDIKRQDVYDIYNNQNLTKEDVEKNLYKNTTNESCDITLDTFEEDVQTCFNDSTYWDRIIYDKYIKNKR